MEQLWDSLYALNPALRSEREILGENLLEDLKVEVEFVEEITEEEKEEQKRILSKFPKPYEADTDPILCTVAVNYRISKTEDLMEKETRHLEL